MHKEASFFEDTRSDQTSTQSTISLSRSINVSVTSDHEKQENMNSSCDSSHSVDIWRKPTKSCQFQRSSSGRDTSVKKGNMIRTGIAEPSGDCFDLSKSNSICSDSIPNKNGAVYKRRKLQKNTFALLSEENAAEITERDALPNSSVCSVSYSMAVQKDNANSVPAAVVNCSRECADNGKPSVSGRNNLDGLNNAVKNKVTDQKNLESAQTCALNKQCSASEFSHFIEGFSSNPCRPARGSCPNSHGASLLSKSNGACASFTTMQSQNNGGCSSSGGISVESLDKFASLEDMCIYVLKRHGLLGKTSRSGASAPIENAPSHEAIFFPCKTCSLQDNAQKMLICDDCDDAFHTYCCRPKIRKLPDDEWYCQSCLSKRKKHVPKNISKTSSSGAGDLLENGGRGALDHQDPKSMLRNIQPYRSRVQIGNEFQVEVSSWRGPVTIGDGYFSEPKEMNPEDFCSLNGWTGSKPCSSSYVGNWLQCKEEDEEGNICGKWRR
ncbi:Methyl-CpG-binding domain-containing protein 9 [Apostasia shenzhenica]|uniref:Methyl-CpG-binding domain-containing protein 9 n=1 Tax=Apostasia shenzhenica TaxID=1088818 RepID=A0A2I0APN9_9ASPA|nr:Methyl-CpG-binding domain-containing protein 9 [Apostasia shenzhenica]